MFLTLGFLVLSLVALPCTAFLRTAPNVSSSDYSFTQFGAVANVKNVVAYNGTGIKSYWWANFFQGTNGHSYCVVITSANSGPNDTVSSLSVTDLNTGYHFGTSVIEPGQLSTTKFEGKSSVLHVGSTAADEFSQTYAVSTLPEFKFDLQWVPKGPILYQGGSGFFEFGADLAYTFDVVEALPSGTLVVNGTNVTVVPENSTTWLDYQWGPGYAIGGWHDWVILLENGVRMQVTVTAPNAAYKQASFTTMVYPDGHQELWPVKNDTQPRNPWVSSLSNITYYSDYVIDIPLKNTILYSHLPVKGGETGPSNGSTTANTIADTFTWINGTFDGLPIKGYGIMELRENAGCTSFGAC
ncbi:hypothetical protein A1O3_03675 [Capronia epimyces CBS 606.96]|uniref:AttH domain-containing protein n=1 Tax=Capronia epimyces CBS 606.96 TaxID=1182542 RepID=W9Y1M9_9EURO|nr:uncharacterized protein A1O3_03675 [Capronia epimyces CBS 606.96]EXJ86722.1 hypothetical protein A1O3_03675 [Capronia epimyces CBS 606.96]